MLTTAVVTVLMISMAAFLRGRGVAMVNPVDAIRRLRRRPSSSSKRKAPSTRKANGGEQSQQFHAVTIECGSHPCPAVLEFRDKPLLSGEAPSLPLRDCDQASCSCRYVHQADRRTQSRRGYHSDLGMMAAVGSNQERRGSSGRRDSDQLDFIE